MGPGNLVMLKFSPNRPGYLNISLLYLAMSNDQYWKFQSLPEWLIPVSRVHSVSEFR